jgi:two-component system response regulator DevR
VDAIRVAVCEGDGALRRRLILALEDDPAVHVVAEAGEPRALAGPCAELGVDCAVVGADESPADTVAALRATCPDARVVLVVSPADAEPAVAALGAGATGFVNRETLDQAPDVTRAVSAGIAALPPLVAASVLSDDLAALTDAERAVIGHLATGRSYRAAAEVLGVDAAEAKAMVAGAVARLQATLQGAGRRGDPGR